ncbi:MAG: AAA family ATPase [Acidimicrobiales bacterium]
MVTSAGSPRPVTVDLDAERHALARARAAVGRKLDVLGAISGGGADALADEYIDAVVAGTVEKLQHELVVFGRIDDDQPWRVGLYGIDDGGDQLVIDWRAPFAGGFYRARFDDDLGLERRVTYVGSITDLFVEDFASGEIIGTSPLLGELARSRGPEMRTAVATLQSEQDELVRLDPAAKLVVRGGPGTGKTVVGLHRAAWLVYNDTRLTAGRILVIGPSDKFLRFVSAVLPTLGEARITQTTFERLLGPSSPAGGDERWLGVLDRFEASLCQPAELRVGLRRIRVEEVAETIDRLRSRAMPWRDQRKVFVELLANRHGVSPGDVSRAAVEVWPNYTAARALKALRTRRVLARLGAEDDLVEVWMAGPVDGALADEVRARFEGVPATYGHVIVDEAQDLTLLQLRAVQRRSAGLSLVGDDAQRSHPHGLGLREAALRLGVEAAEMATSYRMSAEIAGWLNDHAVAHGIDAVELIGIRPTGVAVRTVEAGTDALRRIASVTEELGGRWPNVAVITAADAWSHKGVEYDAVVVDARSMDPSATYMAASRAAHELVLVR